MFSSEFDKFFRIVGFFAEHLWAAVPLTLKSIVSQMVNHILKILQHLLQDSYSVSDHFGMLSTKELNVN